jgi:hypothetical protein
VEGLFDHLDGLVNLEGKNQLRKDSLRTPGSLFSEVFLTQEDSTFSIKSPGTTPKRLL